VRAKLPGCRYPGVAARRAQGGADAQVQPQLKLNRGDPIHYEFTLVNGTSAPDDMGCYLLARRRATGRTVSLGIGQIIACNPC
jgi:hypothetical protein